jgi:hypothetical protein
MQKSSTSIHRLVFPVFLLIAANLSGQLKSNLPQTSSEDLRSVASPSWIDPQRFTMGHSFSLSFLSGSGMPGGGTSLSVYTNQMRFLVTNNLVLNSQINLVQPTMLGGSHIDPNNLQIYYQASMDWQPLRNLNIHFGISNLPSLYRYSAGTRGYYSPYHFRSHYRSLY